MHAAGSALTRAAPLPATRLPRRRPPPACLQGALRFRVARLLFTLQLRLRSQRARLGDFYAWNACLSHILALANVRAACCADAGGMGLLH